jgi:YafQ family addiction module toxin component
MYALETREHVDKIFKKLAKRNPSQMDAVANKLQEMVEDPRRFKPMHFPLAGMRRAHLGGFVILFSVDEQRKTVILEDYEHHDNIYRVR